MVVVGSGLASGTAPQLWSIAEPLETRFDGVRISCDGLG
jgi:hypothetical protein